MMFPRFLCHPSLFPNVARPLQGLAPHTDGLFRLAPVGQNCTEHVPPVGRVGAGGREGMTLSESYPFGGSAKAYEGDNVWVL